MLFCYQMALKPFYLPQVQGSRSEIFSAAGCLLAESVKC